MFVFPEASSWGEPLLGGLYDPDSDAWTLASEEEPPGNANNWLSACLAGPQIFLYAGYQRAAWLYRQCFGARVAATRLPGTGVPVQVEFLAAGGGGFPPYSYRLDFGDGSPTTAEASVTHEYASAGTYEVTLRVTDSSGAEAAHTRSLTLLPNPAVNSIQALKKPFRLRIEGSGFQERARVELDGQPPPAVVWESPTAIELEKGNSLKALLPKGTTVQVKVINPDGGYAIAEYTREAGAAPVAGAGIPCEPEGQGPPPMGATAGHSARNGELLVKVDADPTALEGEFKFRAEVEGTDYVYSYDWQFGDGAAGVNNRSVTHAYASPGTYHWTLSVEDLEGRTGFASGTVTWERALAVVASATPDSGSPPLAVRFRAQAMGGTPPYSSEWEFGDGSPTASGMESDHSYAAVWPYAWRMHVVDAAGTEAVASGVVAVGMPEITEVEMEKKPVLHLDVTGRNFTPGCVVLVNGWAAPETEFKDPGWLVVKGKRDLRGLIQLFGTAEIMVWDPVHGVVAGPHDLEWD